ncbi:ethionine resistance protein [Coemansia sp. RSA 1722]|nr:ethionine resistance protein [Coemansia sp. RSA 1722]
MTLQSNADSETGTVASEHSESTPLLNVSPSETDLEIAKRDSGEPYVVLAMREIWWILSSSSLVTLMLLMQSSFYVANVIAVSHLGANQLASMSLALTCMGILAMSPVYGLLSAMDTFCSTSFTASEDKTLVGFHFQRGIISVFTHLFVVAPILWSAEKILLAINQQPEIARLSGVYLRIQILGTLPSSLFEASKRYLQAQGIVRAGTVIVMVVTPIHWFNNFYLVRSQTHGIGFVGAPIVNVISNWLMFLGALVYIRNSRAIEAWGGWTRSAFHNMSEYYRLAIPAIVTICAEWIGFELLTIGISYFGANQLAGHAIMLNTVILIFQASNGLGYATSPRVGNLIGAAKPRQARIAAEMAVLTSGVIGLIGTLFLVFCGDWWISIYTDDPEVTRETSKLMSVACVFLIADGLNSLLSAVLRGLGRQKISANIFLVGYYCCAMPAGLYLGYGLNMQASGLWWGACIGVMVSCVLQVIYFFGMIDWNDEVRRCFVRLKNSGSNSATSI